MKIDDMKSFKSRKQMSDALTEIKASDQRYIATRWAIDAITAAINAKIDRKSNEYTKACYQTKTITVKDEYLREVKKQVNDPDKAAMDRAQRKIEDTRKIQRELLQVQTIAMRHDTLGMFVESNGKLLGGGCLDLSNIGSDKQTATWRDHVDAVDAYLRKIANFAVGDQVKFNTKMDSKNCKVSIEIKPIVKLLSDNPARDAIRQGWLFTNKVEISGSTITIQRLDSRGQIVDKYDCNNRLLAASLGHVCTELAAASTSVSYRPTTVASQSAFAAVANQVSSSLSSQQPRGAEGGADNASSNETVHVYPYGNIKYSCKRDGTVWSYTGVQEGKLQDVKLTTLTTSQMEQWAQANNVPDLLNNTTATPATPGVVKTK